MTEHNMIELSNLQTSLRQDVMDVNVQTGATFRVTGQKLDLIFSFQRSDVADLIRSGDDLIIVLKDGSTTTLVDFYLHASELVLVFMANDSVNAPVLLPAAVLLGGSVA
jgi:hypothetical protein